MKIIYIPIVVPVNIRTLWALLMIVVAAVLITIAVSTESWLVMKMETDPLNRTSATAISKIVAYQSLQVVDVNICRPSARFQVEFCSTTHVVYAQCDDATDPWCVGRVGFLTALGTGIAAIIVGVISIAVGLVKELALGYFAGLASLCSVMGTIAYASGYNKAVGDGLLAAIYSEAQVEHGTVTHTLGYSFYAFLFGSVLLCSAAGLSVSLFFCAAHGDENRAHQAPKIQLVEMDLRGSAEVAAMAPQPGFVRLDGGATVDYDDDEDDLITVPPPLPASYSSPTRVPDGAAPSTQTHPDPVQLQDLPHE
ncbi:claudin-like protein, putative [Bodo saltans]|uniref:Claudin-like protein, putative n=1 Tax=Bodo saltans TaxID=75058 RepID=A0A0S4JT52_BODSA|nr:claudin-like protein, putative [Bodo saltans]|eukprot:CUG93454.1 claudin-like protein, putative [Bodo saltans]